MKNVRERNGVKLGERSDFVITQLIPHSGFKAIFWEDVNGKIELQTMGLVFLGIATETRRVGEIHEQEGYIELGRPETFQSLVGIVMEDGLIQIVNALNHYCGLMAPGYTPENCLGEMDPVIRVRFDSQ